MESLLRVKAMEKKPIIVAVDGPAASGKSSLCSEVAKKIGWTTLNTGLIYRAVAFVGLKKSFIKETGGLVLSLDEKAMENLAVDLSHDLHWDGTKASIFWNQEELTPYLQDTLIASAASAIAKMPGIRRALLGIQRAIALKAQAGIFVDGRDIGTVVFPDADLKIFLTASLEERSKRRLDQMLKGPSVQANLKSKDQIFSELESIKNEIAARDQQDSSRVNAPLAKDKEAVLFDTTSLNFEESVEELLSLLRKKNLIQ